MIVREDKKFWLMLDISGAVTLMRRDDFASFWLPQGEQARALTDAVKAAHASDPSGEAVTAIYERYNDRFQPLDETGFLPAEIFFRDGGERLTGAEVTAIRVYPRAGGDFAVSMAGPSRWVEATTATTMDEAHRLGVSFSRRFDAELVDLAAMYHCPWVEQVQSGKTHLGFSSWLGEQLVGLEPPADVDFSFQGWLMWDGESDRPWWAPMGEADPLMDLSVYSSRTQCAEDDPELASEEYAQPTRIRIARASGAIQVIGDDGTLFRELSRADYYNEFGMSLPAASAPAVDADDTPTP